MMRILIHAASSVFPYYDGTSLRIFHIIPYLAKNNELDLVQEHWPWESHLEPISPPVHNNSWPDTYFKNVIDVWHRPGEKRRYGFLWESPELYETLDHLIGTRNYDVIFAQNETFPLYAYDRIVHRRKGPVIPPALVGPTDSAHLHYWRNLRGANNLAYAARIIAKWSLYIAYQLKVLNRMPFWTMVTEHDARSMRMLSRKNKIYAIPNGVDVDSFTPDGTVLRDPHSVIFLGTLGQNSPNEKSILWFLREIWPSVIQKVSDARLVIVGRNPSQSLRDQCERVGNVTLVGYTKDIRPYLWGSGISILPMRFGSGIKNKLLESWAAGCAVITTNYGIEGIGVAINNENLIVNDNRKDFISHLIELLASIEKQKKLGESGRITTEKYYRWDLIADHLNITLYNVSHKISLSG